jgi:hypothetical protein
MRKESTELRVDGGASASDLLMQIQSDFSDLKLQVQNFETTALGAAYLAGLAVGFWESIDEIQSQWIVDKDFHLNWKKQNDNMIHLAQSCKRSQALDRRLIPNQKTQHDTIYCRIIGTMLLIILGNGVVANVLLKDTKGNNSGWIVITTAWALAVFVGVTVAGPVSGAHLNPAVTIGLAVAGKFSWESVPSYRSSDDRSYGRSFLVWLFHKDHFAITEDEGAN